MSESLEFRITAETRSFQRVSLETESNPPITTGLSGVALSRFMIMSENPTSPTPPAPQPVPPKMGWFVRDAKTLRMHAKLNINKLAKLADVSRDSVSKIEAGHSVTEVIARMVFDALNTALGGKYDPDKHVYSGLVHKGNK